MVFFVPIILRASDRIVWLHIGYTAKIPIFVLFVATLKFTITLFYLGTGVQYFEEYRFSIQQNLMTILEICNRSDTKINSLQRFYICVLNISGLFTSTPLLTSRPYYSYGHLTPNAHYNENIALKFSTITFRMIILHSRSQKSIDEHMYIS